MSVDYYVYVGPFFRAASTVEHVREKFINTCPSPNCNAHGKGVNYKHCPECGTAIAEVRTEVKVHMSPCEIEDATNGLLSAPVYNKHFFIPNVNYGAVREMLIGVRGRLSQEPDLLADEDICKEKELFQKAFAAEEAILKEVYGEGNVEVCWGVFTYCS